MKRLSLKQGLMKAFFLSIFAIASCTDEPVHDVQPKENVFSVEFTAGMLKFKTIDSYLDLIENKDTKSKKSFVKFVNDEQNYLSLKKSYNRAQPSESGRVMSTQEVEVAETNDMLSSLLNQDGLISIGDYIFKINLAKEQVFVLPVANQDQVNDLKNENTDNPAIRVFSTSDDVLSILTEEDNSAPNGRTEICFSGGYASSNKDEGLDYSPFINDLRQDNKIVYQQAGIYFSLQSKTKMQFKGWTGIWDGQDTYDQIVRYYVEFKPRCKGWSYDGADISDDGQDNTLNYRPYERTRALQSYYFDVFFFGQGYWSRRYTIKG